MKERSAYRWPARVISVVLVPALVAVGIPVSAEPQAKSGPPPAPDVKVNRRTPQPLQPPLYPVFSLIPTTEEIVAARVFGEPILPSGDGTYEENLALAGAITPWLEAADPEATQPFEGFLTTHQTSVWRASVLANLGVLYRRHGYFTRAEEKLVEGWAIARGATDARGRAVAEQVIVDLVELRCSFGRPAALQELRRSGRRPRAVRRGRGAPGERQDLHRDADVRPREGAAVGSDRAGTDPAAHRPDRAAS